MKDHNNAVHEAAMNMIDDFTLSEGAGTMTKQISELIFSFLDLLTSTDRAGREFEGAFCTLQTLYRNAQEIDKAVLSETSK